MNNLGQSQQSAAAMARVHAGASWFNAIALFSIINGVIGLSGSNWHFFLGLATCDIINAFGQLTTSATGKAVAFVCDLVIAGVWALFAMQGKKGQRWPFVVGMIFYLLDGLISIGIKDYIPAAFHAYVLYRLFNGFLASGELKAARGAAQQGAWYAAGPAPQQPGTWPPPPGAAQPGLPPAQTGYQPQGYPPQGQQPNYPPRPPQGAFPPPQPGAQPQQYSPQGQQPPNYQARPPQGAFPPPQAGSQLGYQPHPGAQLGYRPSGAVGQPPGSPPAYGQPPKPADPYAQPGDAQPAPRMSLSGEPLD